MSDQGRDDRQLLNSIGLLPKVLVGISMYVPSSSLKIFILRLLGAKIGKNVYFGPGSILISSNFRDIYIGDNVFIAPGVMLYTHHLSIREGTNIGYQSLFVGDYLTIGSGCNISNRAFIECSYAPISIEDRVTIAASAMISSHDGAYKQTHNQEMKSETITIKKSAFIGNNAIVLPGVTIGERAIIGAGAVVTKDVEKDIVSVGVPAHSLWRELRAEDHSGRQT